MFDFMKEEQVYVLFQKVFINANGFDTMSAVGTQIVGVFEDRASAIDFSQHMAEGIADVNGQHRTFHNTVAKEGRPANFEFALLQRENALYPRFVFECTKERVLSKES